MNIVTPRLSRLDQLIALVASHLDGGDLALYQNDLTPNVGTLLTDLVEADFTGYAAITIATWLTPYIDPLGRAVVLGGLETFTQTGVTDTNTVYGAYYLDAGGALVWAARFDQPVVFGATGTQLNVVPKYILGADAGT